VEPCQPTDGEEHQGYDAHDHHGHDSGHLCELFFVMENVNEAEDKDSDHVDGERNEKHEEVSVVSSPNTVVHPWTMVVEDLNAVITDAAVATPGRSVELTSHTPLHPNRDSIDLYISVKRSSEIIVSVLIRTGPGYHPRVHEGGHGEVDQDKQCYDPLENRDRVPLLLQDIPLDTWEIEEESRGSQEQHPGECCW